MLQVVTPDEMRSIEERALLAGVSQEELMERAGVACATLIMTQTTHSQHILVICGKGNNGGDGYVTARHLHQSGFSVSVWHIQTDTTSPLLEIQKKRYVTHGGHLENFNGQSIPQNCLIVDAIFGIGFRGNVDGLFQQVITKINDSGCTIISIDIPSGLNGETGEAATYCVRATTVAAIEFPKLGFYLKDGWNYCGDIIALPIGLQPFAEPAHIQCLEKIDLKNMLPRMQRNRHKYEAGHVVGLAGSKGMMGAAYLASWAALKSGCGICHLLYPESTSIEANKGPLEIISIAYPDNTAEVIKNLIQRANACFIGPGLGRSADTILGSILQSLTMKCVLDADALNWISKILSDKNNSDTASLHSLRHSILTPHINEMHRLLGDDTKESVTRGFLTACQTFTTLHLTHLVLKGGPTFLFSHDTPITIMPFGDPGMATAGSGDVLTGILASLMAQGLTPLQAMNLGTSIHGIAGMIASKEKTSYCITASILIEYLPHAFVYIRSLVSGPFN